MGKMLVHISGHPPPITSLQSKIEQENVFKRKDPIPEVQLCSLLPPWSCTRATFFIFIHQLQHIRSSIEKKLSSYLCCMGYQLKQLP